MEAVPTITVLPDIQGATGEGDAALVEFLKPGRYALVWWHPQALSPAACRSCSGPRGAEPIKLLREIYGAGCDVIGVSYESPERMSRYFNDLGLIYPAITVGEPAASTHGVAKAEGEPWPSVPHRVAFLVDEHRQVINRYEVHDVTVFLRSVLGDVKAGPPPSKWTPVKKRKKFLGIL